MRKISYLLVASAILFSACQEAYKKGDDGMQYKIITSGSGEKVKAGQFIEIHFSTILSGGGKKDSVLNSTRELGVPQIAPLDSNQVGPFYYKLFMQMRKGDSLSTKTFADTIIKKNPQGLPPFIKKGMIIYTNMQIVNVYKTQEEADKAKTELEVKAKAAAKVKADALAAIDDKTLADFIAKNKVTATKTKNGVYVQTITAGTGAALDTTVFAKIKYTGKDMDGKMFDSNTDSSKGHTDLLSVNLTRDMSLGSGVIPGMSEALIGMTKGTVAKIYIPSGLAYGARGAGEDIKPNANLIFDIEIVDIVNTATIKAETVLSQKKQMQQQKAMQAQQEASQKQYMDSLQKVDPKKAEELKQQMQQQMMQQMQQQQGGQPGGR
jgi:FKBP-type peptidyl-prolyl cis-trans isomerase FkpA